LLVSYNPIIRFLVTDEGQILDGEIDKLLRVGDGAWYAELIELLEVDGRQGLLHNVCNDVARQTQGFHASLKLFIILV